MSQVPKFTIQSTDSPDMLILRDQSPGIEKHHSKVPEHVDHQLDFRVMRYQRTAVFRNDDPFAESEMSQASGGFHVRRTDAGIWEARLVARNFSTLDKPGEWEQVPQWLAAVWEQTWQRRSH